MTLHPTRGVHPEPLRGVYREPLRFAQGGSKRRRTGSGPFAAEWRTGSPPSPQGRAENVETPWVTNVTGRVRQAVRAYPSFRSGSDRAQSRDHRGKGFGDLRDL